LRPSAYGLLRGFGCLDAGSRLGRKAGSWRDCTADRNFGVPRAGRGVRRSVSCGDAGVHAFRDTHQRGADLGTAFGFLLGFGNPALLLNAGRFIRMIGRGVGRIQFGFGRKVMGDGRRIFRDVLDGVASGVEANAMRIFDGDVQRAQNERRTLQIDGVAHERVHDFHERGLDGLLVFDESDGVQARVRRRADAADHTLMEVAELLAAKGRRTATHSGDLNVSARFDAWVNWHIDPIKNFFVVAR